jgi:6-phosphogluconolactonase
MKSILLFSLISFSSMIATAQKANLLVGTYTQKGSKGIYVLNFDTTTGKLVELSHTNNIENPSFLTITEDHQFVYAVNEKSNGMLTAFSLENNKLKQLNQVATNGADPCHLTLSKDQKNIFVANYSGGSIAQFYRFADGRVSKMRQQIKHEGKSVNVNRQEKAHVHGTFFNPSGNYLFTPDLGMDQVSIYPYQSKANPLLDINNTQLIQTSPGAGPRHLTFSNNGKFIYLAEELTGTISVFSFQNEKAQWLQTVMSHPANYNGQPGSADIHMSPDNKYIYVSNRGEENNIAKFPVLDNGKLAEGKTTYFKTQGVMPRNFTISKDGKWLLVAHQGSDSIVVFKINEMGDLISTGNSIKLSMPVCLVLF